MSDTSDLGTSRDHPDPPPASAPDHVSNPEEEQQDVASIPQGQQALQDEGQGVDGASDGAAERANASTSTSAPAQSEEVEPAPTPVPTTTEEEMTNERSEDTGDMGQIEEDEVAENGTATPQANGNNEEESNGDNHDQPHTHTLDNDDEEGFDPATLANLAALSRIVNEDEEDDLGAQGPDHGGREEPERREGEAEDALETDSPRHEGPLTREQVEEFMSNLNRDKDKDKDDTNEGAETGGERRAEGERTEEEEEDDGEDDGKKRKADDEDYEEEDKVTSNGRQRRKRNRTVLMSSKKLKFLFYRNCDRNIPCSRCIKRGVPGMCRMEHPVLPQRKRRKVVDDEDINYELGLRVQALESLLRSGSLMDADQASAAAKETIMHATRAANAGSQDANNALAQLTQSVSAGGGIGGLSQDAQSSLLLDVLQQLTAASMGRPLNSNGSGEGTNRRGLELWSTIPTASQETSVAVSSAYNADEVPTKLNLSLPGFREDNGKIFVPPTVRYVEKNLRNENILSREALPVEGYAPFLDVATRFAYGADSQPYRHRRIASIQAISLTGALRLAATFLSRFPSGPTSKTVYVPSPTADEDTTALQDAGLEIRSFRFLDLKTGGVDWENLREDLQDAPMKSVVLIQVSGSMPSGAELTTNQWRLLATLLQERELIPLVMMAYQGLSTGDTNRDAQALRFMVHEGLPVVLVQSFDAMMGLYADSPAAVSIVTQNVEDRERVDSQLRAVARGMWFHPSPWGAQVAHQILSDPKMHPAWLAEIKAMSDRLRSVREKLYDLLANKLKTPGTWFHLKRASGMYCTALLPPSQAEALTTKRHVHLLPDGCFNLGCLNAPKIDILARAIDHVVREGIREAEEQQAQRLAMELALAAAKEQQAREEAEAAAAAEAAEAAAAREEDTLLMERSIANAIEAQKRAEEEENIREEERKVVDEQQKKAMERAEIARQAEAILATISGV